MNLRSILGASVAACALLAGCGSPAAAPASSAASTPTSAPTSAPASIPTSAPSPGAPAAAPAPAVELPWPGRSAAEAAGLQQIVDDGAQPWLLDPAELARSYASAAYGWDTVTATATGDSVEVTGPGGVRHVLTVAQPDRTGPGGIWLVTADSPA